MPSQTTERPMTAHTVPARTTEFGQEALINQLMVQDFECAELALYLDTHPDDSEALARLKAATQRSRILRDDYENRFGPLSIMGKQICDSHWSWVDAPWPWDCK